WQKTFPRGPKAAAGELLRRLPRRFYPAALGAAACAAAAVLALLYLSPELGCWTLVVVGAGVAGAVILGRRAARVGAVVLPAPERRQATRPATATGPGATPEGWSRAEPTPVDEGERLPVRLQGNIFSTGLFLGGYAVVFGAIVVAVLLSNALKPWRDRL